MKPIYISDQTENFCKDCFIILRNGTGYMFFEKKIVGRVKYSLSKIEFIFFAGLLGKETGDYIATELLKKIYKDDDIKFINVKWDLGH